MSEEWDIRRCTLAHSADIYEAIKTRDEEIARLRALCDRLRIDTSDEAVEGWKCVQDNREEWCVAEWAKSGVAESIVIEYGDNGEDATGEYWMRRASYEAKR